MKWITKPNTMTKVAYLYCFIYSSLQFKQRSILVPNTESCNWLGVIRFQSRSMENHFGQILTKSADVKYVNILTLSWQCGTFNSQKLLNVFKLQSFLVRPAPFRNTEVCLAVSGSSLQSHSVTTSSSGLSNITSLAPCCEGRFCFILMFLIRCLMSFIYYSDG